MRPSRNRVEQGYGLTEVLVRSCRALRIVVLAGAAAVAVCGHAAPPGGEPTRTVVPTVQQGNGKKPVQHYVQAPDASDASRIFGRWHTQTTVGEALLGTIDISSQRIDWDGETAPRCTSRYSIETVSSGPSYPEQVARPGMRTTGRIYVTYRLKIEDRICARTAAFLQISTMSDVDEAAVVILYNQSNQKDAEFTISR